MLSFVIVVKRVISVTPTDFFLNPSFQSAYTHGVLGYTDGLSGSI